MHRLKKCIIGIVIIAILIPIFFFGYFYTKMNSMYEKTDISEELIGIEGKEEEEIKNDVMLDDNIINILLIGTDGRTESERGRSDSMMIATIDEKHKSLKLTSLARDTYVKIPGRGQEKLNHAYSYGGANLLINTIENNFGVGISSYVNVNFSSFIDIIDALGGITLDINASELSELNKYIPECYEASSNKKNSSMKLIEKPGTQVLNGYQALSYSRIRKNDNAFERDGRQRKVLQSLLTEMSNMSFGEVTKVANAMFPHVKTNIKPMEMMKYLGKVLKIGNFDIKQLEFPIAEYSKGGIVKNKGWVLQFNATKCLPILHKFIFEDDISDKYLPINNYMNTIDSVDDSRNDSNNIKDNNSSIGSNSSTNNKPNEKPSPEEKPSIPEKPPVSDNENSNSENEESSDNGLSPGKPSEDDKNDNVTDSDNNNENNNSGNNSNDNIDNSENENTEYLIKNKE